VRVRRVFERVAAALGDTSAEFEAYRNTHAEFDEIAGRMLTIWWDAIAALK
jgi:hypothetical protein